MLILTRVEGEAIKIDGPAVIRVQRVGPTRVRIGIEADGDVRILRGELEEERKEAA